MGYIFSSDWGEPYIPPKSPNRDKDNLQEQIKPDFNQIVELSLSDILIENFCDISRRIAKQVADERNKIIINLLGE